MTSLTVPTWATKHPNIVTGISMVAHAFAALMLMLCSVPRGYDSFDDAHGGLGAVIGVACYLAYVGSNNAETRRFALGMIVGAWLALIAPDLEHRLYSLLGYAFFAVGVWATEVSRKLDHKPKFTWQ